MDGWLVTDRSDAIITTEEEEEEEDLPSNISNCRPLSRFFSRENRRLKRYCLRGEKLEGLHLRLPSAFKEDMRYALPAKMKRMLMRNAFI